MDCLDDSISDLNSTENGTDDLRSLLRTETGGGMGGMFNASRYPAIKALCCHEGP